MNPLVSPLLPAQAPWPATVRAAFTTRHGGASLAPYDSWNLGDHVGDEAQRVQANRLLLRQRTGARPVFLQQVHGVEVLEVTARTADGCVADACWTDEADLACTAMVADCLPVLFASGDGRSVAAVHAGWRGLLGPGGHGVLEALCAHWPAAQTAEQRRHAVVWLGPCIGPQAFEVGAEVRDAFVSGHPPAEQAFVACAHHPAKFWAHLPLLARQRLAALGFEQVYGNNGEPDWCTVHQASHFFSHRRDAVRLGHTGRMAAVIWRHTGGAA